MLLAVHPTLALIISLTLGLSPSPPLALPLPLTRCYWQFPTTLVPASGACWRERFGQKLRWSNMLCAHEPPVLARPFARSRAMACPPVRALNLALVDCSSVDFPLTVF